MSEFAYIYTYTYNYTRTYALKLRRRRSTSSPSSFPVSGFEDCAFCLCVSIARLSRSCCLRRSSLVDGPFLAVFALTPFQQQPIFKTSKVSRIRIRIYHVNIAHAQSVRRTRTGRDGRTRDVDIINGGAAGSLTLAPITIHGDTRMTS